MAVFLWPHPLHRKNSVITPVKCWWIGDVKPSVSSSDGHQYFVSDSNDWTDEPTLYMYDVWPWHKNISSYVYIYIYLHIHWHIHQYIYIIIFIYIYTSSTAQGGGGSFKNRKPIGEECCCGAKMAERSHWLTERWLCVLFWRHDGARQHSGSRRFLSAVARTKLPWLIPTAALPSCRQTQPRHFMVDGF